ncbi:MAG TPA: hypothetical protein VFU50_10700 [Terriglobales bacterium]|nr:hypothetical protein [Terriglobales bacterium]
MSVSAHVSHPVRRSQRFKVNFAIKLFTIVQQRKCVLQGRSHDLCEDGMAIYIPAELQRGQVVQMEFILRTFSADWAWRLLCAIAKVSAAVCSLKTLAKPSRTRSKNAAANSRPSISVI